MNKKFKKIVIKIGTSLITRNNNREINKEFFENITNEISNLMKEKKIVIVSSGAIGLGMLELGLTKRPKKISEKQAVAAIGQPILMNIYANYFKKYNIKTAQLLLTHGGLQNRERYINASNTLQELIKEKVIPIINENDTVATEEIKFGDNDKLAALTAILFDADLLVLLTDIDGLYANINDKNSLINEVSEITKKIEEYAQPSKRESTVGGFKSKIESAKIAVNSGVNVLICNGKQKNSITKFLNGEKIGTYFKAKENGLKGKKKYIAYNLKRCGEIIIDEGAKIALIEKNKSLLPSGIINIKGNFNFGDCVSIIFNNKEIGCGLVNYDAEFIKKLKGLKSAEIKNKYNDKYIQEEVIHKDNLVIF
ncbi:MAG TPA: glutamate 5-kinase [bacterium]|nr:glutamate 5-kinase [bacterium]HOL47038.1 glutamate 5-kinase [bacterium]HPQ18460.1 glutamate 5-kinase [bacterium]